MNWKETITKELKVAFSLISQPLWFRVAKWSVIISLVWLFSEHFVFWIAFFLLIGLGIALHFYYRKKTNGWTKSYGAWHYDKVFNNE